MLQVLATCQVSSDVTYMDCYKCGIFVKPHTPTNRLSRRFTTSLLLTTHKLSAHNLELWISSGTTCYFTYLLFTNYKLHWNYNVFNDTCTNKHNTIFIITSHCFWYLLNLLRCKCLCWSVQWCCLYLPP